MEETDISIIINKYLEEAHNKNYEYELSLENDPFYYDDDEEETIIVDDEKEISDGNGIDEVTENLDEVTENLDEVTENLENVLDDKYFGNCKKSLPHPDIFKKFVVGAEKYNLQGCFFLNNDEKLWKKAMYKNVIINEIYISEDMQLYSLRKKQIISNLTYSDNGDITYSFSFKTRVKRLYLRDVLASTFLYTPYNAVTAMYKTWNSTGKKYINQNNHFTNIRWLTTGDFCNVSKTKGFESYMVSRHGDIYNNKYKVITEKFKKNGLRLVTFCINGKHTETYQIHKEVAKHFVKRPSREYKYVVHRDGDLSNNDYTNLVWLKTLSGIHNDEIRYFEIPNCPEYVISEKCVPYSFKFGTLKQMTLVTDKDGYKILQLTNIKGGEPRKTYNLRFNRVVSVTLTSDYSPDLDVDHIDVVRGNNALENLRNVDRSTNIKNVKKYPRGRTIQQLDLQGNIIETFENSIKAEEKLRPLNRGLNNQNILKCARNNEKEGNEIESYRGFIWKFVIKKEKYIPAPGEIFKPLIGLYNGVLLGFGNYIISNLGTIVNIEKGYKKWVSNNLYPLIPLDKNGETYTKQLHRLVALVFVPGRTQEKDFVNHIDEDPGNFQASNLEWLTMSENAKHSSYKRCKPVKKICPKTKEILNVYTSRLEASISCGGTSSHISQVCNKENRFAFGYIWKDLLPEEYDLYPDLKIKRTNISG